MFSGVPVMNISTCEGLHIPAHQIYILRHIIPLILSGSLPPGGRSSSFDFEVSRLAVT